MVLLKLLKITEGKVLEDLSYYYQLMRFIFIF